MGQYPVGGFVIFYFFFYIPLPKLDQAVRILVVGHTARARTSPGGGHDFQTLAHPEFGGGPWLGHGPGGQGQPEPGLCRSPGPSEPLSGGKMGSMVQVESSEGRGEGWRRLLGVLVAQSLRLARSGSGDGSCGRVAAVVRVHGLRLRRRRRTRE